ncbi:MAG: glycosyl hydrolase family 28-related protein, partial [Phycisphaerae bacterium]
MIRTFLKCLIVSGGCLALFALAPAAFGVGFYNSVNVRDFGAVGDGVADDSAALEAVGRYLSTTYQMAGVYNHGAVAPDVIFPAGTYRITRVICWPGGYARSTPPPPGGVNGYRMIGYHFMRGQGGATIRQDNASADIFFLSGAYRTLIDNLTFQGGQRALKLNTYNVDSSSITIQNCRFQNSGDFAIECITRRAATATPPDPSEPDQFSMTEIAYQYSRYDMYDNGTIRGYLDNSTTVPLFYNSTQMCVSNTQFTNCKGIAYSTCDGFYITNCTMDTAAAMTGPAIRNGGIMVIDNVTAMVRLTPGNGQYWIEHIAFPCSGSVIVRNSTLTTDSATGVCPVYNRQKWSSGNATTQKLVVLEDSMFQVSGCPENCVVYCTEVPNIISIRNCTNSGASAVPALGFSTVPIPSYFSFYAWYWPYVGLGYTVDAANANITPNLPSSMVPYARVPLPEAQDMVIRTALQPNKEAFLSEATMEEPGTVVVNVTTYGAKGDAQTDDTVAIRNAIAAAGMNNSVELVFPAGRYCFSDTISLPARVTLRGQGCAAFIPRDMSKVCFRVNDAQRVAVYNCEFQQCAGALDVLISQPGAKILVKKCYFHWMESGTAIRCVGGALESDQTDLAKLRVTDCRFMGNKVCLLSNVSSVFDSTWIFNPFITTADNAALENYGSMRVECVCAVPNENDYRWIRNHGRLLVDSTRFSGEGGACTVENRRVAGISNIVVIQNSWLYNSISAAPKALIYCPNVPDQLILRTNEGLDIPELFSNNPATILVDEWPYDGQGLSSRIYFSGNTVPETVKAVTPPGMIYFDNFENDIAGINPANGNVQVATGQTATWSFITPNPSYIQVVSDTVTGNKVLRINYPAGAWERASLQVDVGAGLADLQSTQALV